MFSDNQKEKIESFQQYCNKVSNNKGLTAEILKKTKIYTRTGKISSNFNHKTTYVSQAK